MALRTAGAYAAFAALWILFSDELASAMVADPDTLRRVQFIKGWAFVAVTAVLLYFRIEEQIRRWSDEVERRRRSEEQLLKTTRALEQTPASVIITDLSGAIEYVNERFTRATGYAREEVIGLNTRFLKSGQTPPEVYRAMWDTITTGGEWRGELLNRRKNGELFWELASMSPVIGADGRITSFLAVKEDITDRKALEEQLRQSQKLEAVGTLAGGVAHDFNNILTIILAGASMQLEYATSVEEQKELATQVVQAANRGAALTRQLLMFSRKHAMQRTNVDLSELVVNLSKLLKRVLGVDVTVETQCAAHLPRVFADAGMLEQVLLNLAVNARDAMPRGGRLTVATAVTQVAADDPHAPDGTPPGAFVRVSVTDTGTGIPAEVLPHIFEPFFTTKGIGKGTGLGLSTAYGIVQQHDGWLQVDSRVGEGTTFALLLPVSSGSDIEPVAAPVATTRPRGRETVLVVDDEPSVRQVTANILTRYGYGVIEAESGDHALHVWVEHQGAVDLLLTDLFMPGDVSGIELARRLQAIRSDLPVLFTSGHRGRFDHEGVEFEPGRNFLAKPYDSATLAQTVRRSLDARDA